MLAAAALGWTFVAVAVGTPGVARWGALGAAVLGIIVCLQAKLAWRLCAIVCAVVLLLGARVEFGEWSRIEPSLMRAADDGSVIERRATIGGFPEAQAEHAAVDPHRPGSWVRASVQTGRGAVPVLLWFDTAPDDQLVPGSTVVLRGRLTALGASSSAAYGIAVTTLDAEPPGWGARSLAMLRAGLRDAASEIPGAELVPGFAVGDTALVGAQLDAAMARSSLTHLVAVSGANCALVTSGVIGVAVMLGAGRRMRILIAGVGLGGFVLVVGPDASVQRAAVMAGVVLVSHYGGKRAIALPALGIAMIVLLSVDPWQAVQPGFALSVVATAGILLLVPSIQSGLRRALRAPTWVIMPLAVACAAQFACGPFLLLVQADLPAVGILANVLAGVAAPLGTGLGLLALVSLPMAPPLGAVFVHLAALPARWVAATAEVCAGLPLAQLPWPGGWGGAILLATTQGLGLLGWLLLTGRLGVPRHDLVSTRRPWAPRARHPAPVRILGVTALGCAAALLVSITLVAPFTARIGTPHDWVIVACDVGQGDALLIQNPESPDSTVLVDTGDDPALLSECLARFSVDRISLLVLTHDHRDHIGALEALAGRVEQAMIAPPNREDSHNDPNRALLRRLDAMEIPTVMGQRGTRSAPGFGVPWRVLAPGDGKMPPDSNAGSLVIRVQSGAITMLLLGDTGRAQHHELVTAGIDLEADIVKVAHHGSRDADQRLLELTGAELGLVSVGAENSYGHPSAELLSVLDGTNITVLRTDELGSIAISGSPDRLIVWSERGPRDVRPDK